MSVLIGYHKNESHEVEIVQDGASVSTRVPGQPCPARAIIEKRDHVIGNGQTTGDGVFDFRYGPFTSGYPEAGIVHYYTYGERILSVEIDLSKKHRGIEASLQGCTAADAGRVVAGLCGNFAAAHTLAFSRAVEAATFVEVPESVQRFRVAALEIERIYNHLYVVMRLATAAAQKVLAAHVAALFEETLRISEALTGRRGIGEMLTTAGDGNMAQDVDIAHRVRRVAATFERLYEQSLASRNYLDRLHGTAVVRAEYASQRGLTGPSLRACGVSLDLRTGEPLIADFQVRTRSEADAFARMEVRAEEVLDACRIVVDQLEHLDPSELSAARQSFGRELERRAAETPHALGVGAAESSTGTVAWLVAIKDGRIASANVSAPSVFGFQAYADAIVGNIFTDVPFAVESFGVSFADAGR